jgi:hypothetical protein
VTTLTPEGVSFSGSFRRLTGQPGPKNVDRGVHISMRHVPTANTMECRLLLTVCRFAVPAFGRRRWFGGHVLAGQDHIPAAAPFTLHTDRLHGAKDGPVLVDLHLADTLKPDPGLGGVVRPTVPAAAVTVPRPFDRVKPGAAFEPGIAGFLTGPDPAVEGGHRPVEPAEGRLLGVERPAAPGPDRRRGSPSTEPTGHCGGQWFWTGVGKPPAVPATRRCTTPDGHPTPPSTKRPV